MNQAESRRKIIKQLMLGGFGIYLVGCSSPESEAPILVPKTDKTPKQEPEEIAPEQINVTYFKKEDVQFEPLAEYFNLHSLKVPLIIALVENEAGVAEAIAFAKENNLPVSVKSGGHSFEGFSSNNGGLVINTSLLKSKEWDGTKLTVGSAVLLKELYDETLPKGRIIPAGSCGTVGIGGLALGGGYGFFARKYGLTCDNLVAATLVDGKGKIHSLSGNDEGLWALRGGGNGNFGVVTSLTFQTHPAPTHFDYFRFKAYKLNAERAQSLLEAWFLLSAALPNSCFSAFVLNGSSLTILITNFEGESAELSTMIAGLTELTDKQSKGVATDVAKQLQNYYGIQHPIYFKNASAGYYQSFADIENCISEVVEKVTSTPGLIYQVNTLGGKINDPDFTRNSCYPHREFGYLSELQSYWSEGQTTKRDNYLRVFEEVQSLFFENGNRRQYRNYPSIGFEHWEEAYFDTNYSRLQQVKKKYDPENSIRHPQSIRLKKK